MKIIVIGSLGNISKPLTEILVAQGHEVTVVSSDEKKRQPLKNQALMRPSVPLRTLLS